MYAVQVGPKLLGETRTEPIDVSSQLGPSDTLVSASATCAVYSGTDANPSAVVGACTVDTTFNMVNVPLTGGVVGCIYQIVVTVVLNTGNKYFTFFLVVTPDAV